MHCGYKGNRLAGLVLLALCASGLTSHGRVFWRWKSSSYAARTIADLGGKSVYESTVTINGGKGRLTVSSFDKPLQDVCRELGKAFGDNTLAAAGGSMSLTTIRSDNGVVKLVAIEPSSLKDQTVVFAVEQDSAEAAASSEAPAKHMLNVVPPYPGSKPVFYARDEKASMSMETSTATASPETIRAFYSERLRASGWESALDGAKKAGAGRARTAEVAPAGVVVYFKGMELCCVLACPGKAGESTVMVMHKRLTSK